MRKKDITVKIRLCGWAVYKKSKNGLPRKPKSASRSATAERLQYGAGPICDCDIINTFIRAFITVTVPNEKVGA